MKKFFKRLLFVILAVLLVVALMTVLRAPAIQVANQAIRVIEDAVSTPEPTNVPNVEIHIRHSNGTRDRYIVRGGTTLLYSNGTLLNNGTPVPLVNGDIVCVMGSNPMPPTPAPTPDGLAAGFNCVQN